MSEREVMSWDDLGRRRRATCAQAVADDGYRPT